MLHQAQKPNPLKYSRLVPIAANDSGELPTAIEILRQGHWDTPGHGKFEVTEYDIDQYIENFQNDVRAHSSSQGLPIDREHKTDEGAAGWIVSLFKAPDSVNPSKLSLWGNAEWSASGERDLKGKEYKFFSPHFSPFYIDPEGKFETTNVLQGGALTTRPLFKDLMPVMASEGSGDGRDNQLFVNNNSNKESKPMNIEDIRKKDPSTLNADERTFLADHKSELSAEEKKSFGFAEDASGEPTPAATPAPAAAAVEPQAAAVAASDNGEKTVTIAASELEALQATSNEYRKDKATTIVEKHIERGAIKASEKDSTVDFLLSLDVTNRSAYEKQLENLPGREILASEIGGDSKGSIGTATEELAKKVNEVLASDAGKGKTFGEVQSQVLASDADLNSRVNAERNIN